MVFYHNWQPFWGFLFIIQNNHVVQRQVHATKLFFWAIIAEGRGSRPARNIAAPLDPASFSDAIVQIYVDNGGDLVRPSLGVPFLIYCFNQ